MLSKLRSYGPSFSYKYNISEKAPSEDSEKSTDQSFELNENSPVEDHIKALTQLAKKMEGCVSEMQHELEHYKSKMLKLEEKIDKLDQAITFQKNVNTLEYNIKQLGRTCDCYKHSNNHFKNTLREYHEAMNQQMMELSKVVSEIKSVKVGEPNIKSSLQNLQTEREIHAGNLLLNIQEDNISEENCDKPTNKQQYKEEEYFNVDSQSESKKDNKSPLL